MKKTVFEIGYCFHGFLAGSGQSRKRGFQVVKLSPVILSVSMVGAREVPVIPGDTS